MQLRTILSFETREKTLCTIVYSVSAGSGGNTHWRVKTDADTSRDFAKRGRFYWDIAIYTYYTGGVVKQKNKLGNGNDNKQEPYNSPLSRSTAFSD